MCQNSCTSFANERVIRLDSDSIRYDEQDINAVSNVICVTSPRSICVTRAYLKSALYFDQLYGKFLTWQVNKFDTVLE